MASPVLPEIWIDAYFENGAYRYSLGCDPLQAKELKRAVRAMAKRSLSATDIEVWLSQQLPVPPPPTPITVHELALIHEERFPEGADRIYRIKLLRVIETVVLHPAKPVRPRSTLRTVADFAPVCGMDVSWLDEKANTDYQKARRHDLPPGNKRAASSRQAAIWSELHSAYLVFSDAARAHFAAKGIVLPNVRRFINAPLAEPEPLPPPAELIQRLHDGLAAAEREKDEYVFLAIALTLRAGLTVKELGQIERDWIVPPGAIAVKGKAARTVPLPPWLYQRLMARPTGRILPGTVEGKGNIRDQAVDFLRRQGCPEGRLLHDCRCAFAAFLCSVMTPQQARVILGAFWPVALASYHEHKLKGNTLTLWQRSFSPVPNKLKPLSLRQLRGLLSA